LVYHRTGPVYRLNRPLYRSDPITLRDLNSNSNSSGLDRFPSGPDREPVPNVAGWVGIKNRGYSEEEQPEATRAVAHGPSRSPAPIPFPIRSSRAARACGHGKKSERFVGIVSTATLARLATHRTDPRHTHGLSACALPPTCALPSSTFRSPRISHPTPPRTRTLSRLGRSARLGLGSGSTRFVCEEHGDGDRAPLARLPDLNPNSTTAAQGGLAAQ
jgi:hypothetical protein